MATASGYNGAPTNGGSTRAAAADVVACADGYERFDIVPISGGSSGRSGRGRRNMNLTIWLAPKDPAITAHARSHSRRRRSSRAAPVNAIPCHSTPCSPSLENVLTACSARGVCPSVRNRAYRRSSETDSVLLRRKRQVRDLREVDEHL